MKLNITPSDRGRNKSSAVPINTADSILGNVIENRNVDNDIDINAFGDFSGEKSSAQLTAMAANNISGVVDDISQTIKVYQNGRDNEELRKLQTDFVLFDKKLKIELQNDYEASADEKRDVYIEKLKAYKADNLNASKLSRNGFNRAKDIFNYKTETLINLYSAEEYQKDHIADYLKIEDAEYDNLQNLAAILANSGEPTAAVEMLEIVKQWNSKTHDPKYLLSHPDAINANEKQSIGLLTTYAKNLPTDMYNTVINDSVIADVIKQTLGEATYYEWKEELDFIHKKKRDQAENEANKISGARYDELLNKMLQDEYISPDKIMSDKELVLSDKNRLIAKSKQQRREFESKQRFQAELEHAAKERWVVNPGKMNQHYNSHFNEINSLSVDKRFQKIEKLYIEPFGTIPTTLVNQIDTPFINDPVKLQENIYLASKLQEVLPPDQLKLSDEMIDLLSKTKHEGGTIDHIQEYQNEYRADLNNSKRVIKPISEKQFNDNHNDTVEEYIEEWFDSSEITPYIKSAFLKIYSQKLHNLKSHQAALTATQNTITRDYHTEVDGSGRIMKNGFMSEASKKKFNSEQSKEFLEHQLDQFYGKNKPEIGRMERYRKTEKGWTFIAYSKSGRLLVDSNKEKLEFLMDEQQYNTFKTKQINRALKGRNRTTNPWD